MTLYVQVGQCGNQVAGALWDIVLREHRHDRERKKFRGSWPRHGFLQPDGALRTVLLDSEPKVVQGQMRKFGGRRMRLDNVFFDQNGRGNNWAMGYHGGKKGGTACSGDGESSGCSLVDASLESIRRECERSDSVTEFLVFHSLSGGTGSGVGSHLVEELRDLYPPAFISTVCVAPHASGESALQNFNAILTLSHTLDFVDCVTYFSNRLILDALSRSLKAERQNSRTKGGGSYVRVTNDDINNYIASCLAGVLMPVRGPSSWSVPSLGGMCPHICPLPLAKFTEVHTAPFVGGAHRPHSWRYIAEGLRGFVPRFDAHQDSICTLNGELFVRGDADKNFLKDHSQETYQVVLIAVFSCTQVMSQMYRYPSFDPQPASMQISHAAALPGHGITSSMTMLANRTSIVDELAHFLDKSRLTFESGAYVHWYERYGCDREHFQDAFETIQQVIDFYEEMTV